MSGSLAALPVVFAQNAPAGGAGAQNYYFLLWFAVIGFWFYFLMIRPQQKQEKQRRSMLDAMKKNDRVLTSAGIYGTVISIDTDHDKVVLRIDDERGVKVAFTRASIVRVIDADKDKDSKDKEKAAGAA